MKKIYLYFMLLFLILLNTSNVLANLEIGTGGVIEKVNIFSGLECIKYNDYTNGLADKNNNLYELLNYNFIQKEQKNKKDSKKYEKFNQCQINYKYNPEKQKYEKFSVYNKYKM